MRGWRFISIALLVVLMVLSVPACGLGTNASQNQQKIPVSSGDLTIKANGSGKVGVDVDAKPSFGTGGKLVKLNIKEGDRVTKGSVLAQFETDNLELALSQAKVGVAQGQVALAQAQAALAQAQIAQTQAQTAQIQSESSVSLAQFNLDRIKVVKDIKDDITKAQTQILYAELLTQDAQLRSDPEGATYWKMQKANYQMELARNQKKLAELLVKPEFTGVATYEIEGQTYDRLVVEDVRLKQLALQSAQQSVEQAKENVELAKQNVELARGNINLAQKSLEQAAKAIEVNQKQLANATILAPIDGTVLDLNIKEGDTVSAVSVTTPVYIIDTNTIQVSALIDEIDIPGVKVGQAVTISLDSSPDMQYNGKVNSISLGPTVNTQNTGVVVYEVKVGFTSPPPPEVKLGMSATVDIVTNQRKGVLLVPNRAIQEDDQGNPTVDVLVNDKTEPRLLKLGISDGVNTEVISGLNPGDIIVITRNASTQGFFGQ
jgi:HlyD family secretion protein